MPNAITLTDEQRAEVLGHLARLEALTEHDLTVIIPHALEQKIAEHHARLLADDGHGHTNLTRDAGAYTLATLHRLDPERAKRVREHHGNPHQWSKAMPERCMCHRDAADLIVVREAHIKAIREEREAREAADVRGHYLPMHCRVCPQDFLAKVRGDGTHSVKCPRGHVTGVSREYGRHGIEVIARGSDELRKQFGLNLAKSIEGAVR